MKTDRPSAPSVFAISLLLALVLALTALGQERVLRGRVVGVTDGDTLKVLVGGQQLLRVRLAFCDAPEKRQAFGARAKQAMSELAFGKDAELRTHASDRYGRTVAQVFVDGQDVGLEMLREGYAWVYDRYIVEASTDIQKAYQEAQEEAKSEGLGLWSDPNSIPPWIFRDLAKANQEQAIASNWLAAHPKQIDPNTPNSRLASPNVLELPLNPDDVWVNTKSGKYWKPGSLYYGKTKRGEYLSEKEAVQKGYCPANGTGE